MPVSSGDRIGRYEVLGLIGKGGMGEVYRAKDTRLGRSVAIKILPKQLANDADYIARFEREAQVLASLNHPNIAAIYGVENDAIVMDSSRAGRSPITPRFLPKTHSSLLARLPAHWRSRTRAASSIVT